MRVAAILVAVAAIGSNDAARFAGAYIPGGAIHTARLASGAVAAVAERAPAFDRSWASSLLVTDGKGAAARELVDRVFHASRPLPLPSGEIVVERGVAGALVPGRVRVDELTLDAVDPKTRAVRTIYRTTGFEAHLAALAGDEVIVYLIQPGAASLRGIDWHSGRERVVVATLPPWAHDFSATTEGGNALVVHNRDDAHRERETVDRIDLANGNVTRLETR